MISIGLRCHPGGIYYTIVEVSDEARRIVDRGELALDKNQDLPGRLYACMDRFKTIVNRFKEQGNLQGVALKRTEFAALRQNANEGMVIRLYLEGTCQVALQECGVTFKTFLANQVTASLQTSQRLDGYAAAGEFRELEGVDALPKSKRKEYTEAAAVALCILEGRR